MEKHEHNKKNKDIHHKYGNIHKVVKHESNALNSLANCDYREPELAFINLMGSLKGRLVLTGVGKSGIIAQKISGPGLSHLRDRGASNLILH